VRHIAEGSNLTVREPVFFASAQLIEGLSPLLAREAVPLLQHHSEEGEAICLQREVCHDQGMGGEELEARAHVAALQRGCRESGGQEEEQQSAHEDEYCPEDAGGGERSQGDGARGGLGVVVSELQLLAAVVRSYELREVRKTEWRMQD
jgi:hypothetical protein